MKNKKNEFGLPEENEKIVKMTSEEAAVRPGGGKDGDISSFPLKTLHGS